MGDFFTIIFGLAVFGLIIYFIVSFVTLKLLIFGFICTVIGTLIYLGCAGKWGPFIVICVIIGVIILCILAYLINKLNKKWQEDARIRNEIKEKEKKDEEERIRREAELEKIKEEERIYEKYHHYEKLALKLQDVYKRYKTCAPIDEDYRSKLQFIDHSVNSLEEIPIPTAEYISKCLNAEMNYINRFKDQELIRDGYPSFRIRMYEIGLGDVPLPYTYKIPNNDWSDNYRRMKKSFYENYPDSADAALSCISREVHDSVISYDQNAIISMLDKDIEYILGFAIKLDKKADGRDITNQQIDKTFNSILSDIYYLMEYHYLFVRPLLFDLCSKMKFLWKCCRDDKVPFNIHKHTWEYYSKVDNKFLNMGINP